MKPTVLVVGAGPTGLTLASELRRHGLDCRVVDVLDAPVTYSKAAIVHARTMEIFEAMGASEAVLARSKAVHGVNVYQGDKRVLHATFDEIDSPFPHMYGVSQHDTELALTAHLESQGAIVERGKKLTTFVEEKGGITAELASADGSIEKLFVDYLVGCDGAHSRVREVLGIPFEGSSYEERLIQADVKVDWPKHLDDDELCSFLHPGGVLACFPLFRDGRYRIIAMLGKDSELEPTLENFQRLVEERAIRGAKVSDPAWMVGFRIHCRMVPRYAVGRAFLAGDAAHIHSPVGGQGMNTGIQDAFNLAWKLALVAKGAGKPVLLASYDAERRPVARATLDATDAATRRGAAAIRLRHPLAVELRNQLIGFVGGIGAARERIGQTISMLGIHYRDSPILGQHQTSVWSAVGLSGGSSSEAPNLVDWAQFGGGPGPGDRAPDVVLPGEAEGRRRLFEVLRGTSHALLLFDGAGASSEGYQNLDRIARRVRDRWGAVVTPHAVLPFGRKPAGFAWDGSIIHDADGAMHQRFGARSECLYLVRPDGHVAYRCQPAEGDKLVAYLQTIFV